MSERSSRGFRPETKQTKQSYRQFGNKKDFVALFIMFICLVIYAGVVTYQLGHQTTKLTSERNGLQSSFGDLEKTRQQEQASASTYSASLQSKINSLQTQLNQKPTTVYVPQTSSDPANGNYINLPKTSHCTPDGFGGLNCTSN